MGFQFKRFHISDERTAMKVGTDGVLLGAWTVVGQAKSILDIGSGSGIIPLMIAQRSESRSPEITGVEVDKNAWLDAVENVEGSPWKNRIMILLADFNQIQGEWDLITSNPPFFSSPIKSPDDARALARHGGTLNYFSLIDYASQYLSEHGSLSLISDVGIHDSELIYHAEKAHLKVRRETHVVSKEGGETIRILRQFSRKDGPIERTTITIRRDNDLGYTETYKKLTKDFYLHF